jgi:hypothetical protein
MKDLIRLTMFVCLSIVVLSSLMTTSASASSKKNTADTPKDIYTIRWIDASTGHVQKSWQGSYDQAEKIKAKEREKYKRPSQTLISPLINRVFNCVLPNDFFVVYTTSHGIFCWANAGYTDNGYYYMFDTYEVDAGLNHGSYSYCAGNVRCGPDQYIWVSIYYRETDFYNRLVAVKSINILPA